MNPVILSVGDAAGCKTLVCLYIYICNGISLFTKIILYEIRTWTI